MQQPPQPLWSSLHAYLYERREPLLVSVKAVLQPVRRLDQTTHATTNCAAEATAAL